MRRSPSLIGCAAVLALALPSPASAGAPAPAPAAHTAKTNPAKLRFARCDGRQTDGTGCFDVYLGDMGGNGLQFNFSRTYCEMITAPKQGGSWRYLLGLKINRKGRFDQILNYRSYQDGYENDPNAYELKLRVKGNVTSRRLKFRVTSLAVRFSDSFADCRTIKIDETHVLKRATFYRPGGGNTVGT